MEQETTAQRILAELLELGIVQEKDEDVVWAYLAQAYAVGYDYARFQSTHQKPIAQYSKDGRLIKIFESASEAARKTKAGHSEIAKCARGKQKTSGGFQWRYVNTKDPTSCETETQTIGSLKPQSIQPTQKSHVSKTV